MPKVSIVLPTYNGERYLRASINSILSQSFTDWELIIVNDCSSDRTADIAEEYAASDNRIQVVHNAVNQKLPASLNIGFSRAKGKYLTWTSDDNRYLPHALETMVKYLIGNSEAVIVRSDYYFIDTTGVRTGQSEEYSDFQMYRNNCFGACFLYRRKVLEQVGGYDTNAFGVEDYDYWLRVLDKFGKIDSIDEKLYEYRRHGESLSKTKREMVLRELVRLRVRYQEKIFRIFEKDKSKLCGMYYDMLPIKEFYGNFKNRFYEMVPELSGDMGFADEKQFLIFGAGIWGERAAKLLGSRAVYFVDNDMTKEGQVKCGKRILSFKEARKLAEQYHFMIAVSEGVIYELIKQLESAEILEYTTIQSYMNGKENR